MDRLYTERLDITYEDRLIVENLNLQIPEDKITVLVGANGSGKSVHRQSTKEVAKQFAILPQNPTAPDGLFFNYGIQFSSSINDKNWIPATVCSCRAFY